MSASQDKSDAAFLHMEEKIAYLEHACEQRDREMLGQNQEIERLSRAVKVLVERLKKVEESLEGQESAPHEKPPHY